MPLPSNSDAPKNMPPIAWVTIEGFTRFQDMKKYNHKECQEDVKAAMDGDMCRVSNSDAHLLRKAYHSALSFTYAQLCRVMKELKDQGLDKDMIIVLWADHGRKVPSLNSLARTAGYLPSQASHHLNPIAMKRQSWVMPSDQTCTGSWSGMASTVPLLKPTLTGMMSGGQSSTTTHTRPSSLTLELANRNFSTRLRHAPNN